MSGPRQSIGRLRQLAEHIKVHCEQLERQIAEQDLQYPSFTSEDVFDPSSPELHETQHSILEATDELTALVQGPRQSLAMFATEHNKAASLNIILQFSIAFKVPSKNSISFADLATLTNLSTQTLTQTLRHAMTYRIFQEPLQGYVAHTTASRLLVSDSNLVHLIQAALDELLPSSAHLVRAMRKWPESPHPHESGFQLANATSEPIFAVLDRDPARAERFASSMRGFLESPGFSVRHLVDGYAWAGKRKVVDIGGSSGAVARALAERFPGLRCVVQDLPQTIKDSGGADNGDGSVSFMAHDMFSAQPVTDADVYLVRWVLHDWSDEYAAKVLAGLIPALERGAELVINDTCLPEYGAMSAYQQRFLRATSLTMRAIQNGRERDLLDWKDLLYMVDQRLVLKDLVRPLGSELSILIVGMVE